MGNPRPKDPKLVHHQPGQNWHDKLQKIYSGAERAWLPLDWDRTTQVKMLLTQQGGKIFWEWVMDLQGINIFLQGTQSHFSEDAILNQLEANHHPELSKICCNALVDRIKDFHLWLATVSQMDNWWQRKLAWQRQIVEGIYLDRKRRQDQSRKAAGGADCYTTNTEPNTNNTANTPTNNIAMLLALTNNDRDLLGGNDGSF